MCAEPSGTGSADNYLGGGTREVELAIKGRHVRVEQRTPSQVQCRPIEHKWEVQVRSLARSVAISLGGWEGRGKCD